MNKTILSLLLLPTILLGSPALTEADLGKHPRVADYVAKHIEKNRRASLYIGQGYIETVGKLSSGRIVRVWSPSYTEKERRAYDNLLRRTREPQLRVRVGGRMVDLPSKNSKLIDWYAAYLIRNDMSKQAWRSITYKVKNHTYYIDWNTMEQVRVDNSKKRRPVRFYPRVK